MHWQLVIKHLHVTCVVISITGFIVRGLLLYVDSPWRHARWLRIVPHVNDTLLLAAALTLTVRLGQYPFVDGWLTAKVLGLILYIVLGSIALKASPTRSMAMRATAWVAALAVFAYVLSVALSRDPRGFFAALAV